MLLMESQSNMDSPERQNIMQQVEEAPNLTLALLQLGDGFERVIVDLGGVRLVRPRSGSRPRVQIDMGARGGTAIRARSMLRSVLVPVCQASWPVRATLTILCAVLLLAAGQGRAADICEATALRDVPALDNPDSVLKKGSVDESITQFRVNKHTGETSFCSHGSYCYPTHTMIGNGKFQALKMTNCTVDVQGLQEPNDDFIYYGVTPVRAKINPTKLRMDDLDNKFLAMGLCTSCADNVAQFYINKPQSQCAVLAKGALEGNPDALTQLQDNPQFCKYEYGK